MSYTNPSQTADYTLSEGTLIGSTIAESNAQTGDTYAKNLTVDNAAVVMSNTTIDAGGYINATAGAVFKDMTVLSGGTFARTAGVTLSGLTATSGAVLNYVRGGAIRWQGTWNIQSGANFGGYTNIYTDTDGWLNMNGRGMDGAIYCSINVKNITINSYLYHYGRVSSGTVTSRSDNGDALRMQNNAYAEDIHVLSGGSVRFYGESATLRDVVADSGAKISLAANNWLAGRKTTFAKGFISNGNMGNVYAQNGVIYNWTTPANFGAFYFADITLADGDATGQYVYLGTGAETRNFTVTGAAGKVTGIVLGQAGNGAAIDTTATDAGGGITVQSSYIATFGGTNNNVTAGHIFLGGAAACVANPDLSIIGSEFNGLVVKSNTTKEYLVRPKVISGLNAVNAVVSSGGTLTIADGGSATGAVVSADGRLSVGSGGWASGATVAGGIAYAISSGQISGATVNAGVLYFWSGGIVSGATINAGTLRAYKGGIASKVTLNGGYMYFMDDNTVAENNSHGRPAMIGTDIDIVAGSVFWRGSNASGVNVRISGGNGTHYVQNGAHLSGVSVYGGILSFEINTGLNLKDEPYATYADDLLVAGGTVGARSACRVSGATFTGGAFTLYNGAVLNQGTLNAGGAVSAWGSFTNLTMNGGTMSANGYMSGAAVAGGTFNIYNYAKVYALALTGGTLNISNGGQLSDATVAGGTLNVSSGGKLSGAVLNQAGSMRVAGGGSVTNLTVNGGATNSILNLVGSGYVKGLTLSGTIPNSNYIYVYNTAVLEDVTVTSGAIYLPDGGILRNLTQYGAGVPVMRGEHAYCSGATIYGGSLDFQNGGKGQDVVMHDGTTLNVMDNGYGWNLTNGIHGSGAKVSGLDMIGGLANVRAGGALEDVRISGGSVRLTSSTEGSGFHSAYISGATMTGGALTLNAKTSGYDVRIAGGAAYVAGAISGATMTAGTLNVNNGGAVSALTADGGTLNVSTGATGADVTVGENGSAVVAGTMNVKTSAWNVQIDNGGTLIAVEGDTLNNISALAGATVDYANGLKTSGAMLRGDQTNIAANTLKYQGNALDATVADGVMTDLGKNGNNYRLRVGEGITVVNATLNNGNRLYAHETALVLGGTINAGGNIGILGNAVGSGVKSYANYNIFENGSAVDTTVENSGSVRLNNGATGVLSNTRVKSGGKMIISGGAIREATFEAGATLEFGTNMTAANTDTGDLIVLDFTGTGGDQSVSINDLSLINETTRIELDGWTAGNTYTLTTGNATDKAVYMYAWGLYDDRVLGGYSYTNAFVGMTYDFTDGKSIAVTDFEIGSAKATAGTITADDTALNDGERAAKWNSQTSASGNVILAADGSLDGVWLEIDGTEVSGALYGASKSFDGEVNIHAKNGTIRNLAAGSVDGDGSVAGVKLTLDGAHLEGTAYAAGFGTVDGKAETLIAGGTFDKDFYAGALDNYNKGTGVKGSSVGSVVLTVTDGDFSGNLYGASAVKVGSYTDTGVVHAVTQGVNISLEGGEVVDNNEFCCFAGGYATGDAADKVVYQVFNGVNLTVNDGTWIGDRARGGRGVFGGAFAAGVKTVVSDVDMTISGGTIGNVFGGGWAQKNGTSIVGNVNISIMGGTVTNVFGGGTHSSSTVYVNSATEVTGNVTITVSGGTINGDIYARGQSESDTVSGNADVIFTGGESFGCSVWGYSRVPQTDNYSETVTGAALSFSGYTGTFYGKIGGFDKGISLTGDTAMELGTAAEYVTNTAWEFDLTDRDASLSDASLLTWSGADFAGDTVKVTFANDAQAQGGWNIADAAFTGATFDLYVGGSEIATNINYDTEISGGAYDGWKFTDVDGTLKFAKLA